MTDPGGSDDPEAFDYNLPLTALFGDHPKTEILGAMVTETGDPPTAFSANELSRITGLDEGTVRERIEDLREVGIVVEADELDDGTYELDEESAVVGDVRRLNDHLAEVVFRADEE